MATRMQPRRGTRTTSEIDAVRSSIGFSPRHMMATASKGVLVHRELKYISRRTLLALGIAAFSTIGLSTPAASHSPGSEEAQFLAKSDAAMARMMAAMRITPTNDVDRDFVAMMAPHHQGAIDVAEAELIYGHNEALRRLAQEIIVTQQEEIAAMRLALGEPLPSSVPPSSQPTASGRRAPPENVPPMR
jgi:Domain of unknown function (DUF305)